MFMPFGMYRGEPLDQIPTSYLRWLIDEADLRSERLRSAVEAEWQARSARHRHRHRQGADEARQHSAPTGLSAEQLQAVVMRWYRTLCLRWHPDRAGSNEAMRAINDAKDLLDELLADLVRRD